MKLRAIPLHRVENRHNLVLGGDRELVMMSGVLSGVLIFSAQTVYAAIAGIALWFSAIYALRLMAKTDPQLKAVYQAHRKYKSYYPARATPFRMNTPTQGKRYK
jgi:type IV secretory pathway TrbD component